MTNRLRHRRDNHHVRKHCCSAVSPRLSRKLETAGAMARSSAPVTEKITTTTTVEDPLDALLEKLMLDAPHDHKHALIAGLSSVRGDGGDGGSEKPPQRKASSGRASGGNADLDEHDPWKALSDQVLYCSVVHVVQVLLFQVHTTRPPHVRASLHSTSSLECS